MIGRIPPGRTIAQRGLQHGSDGVLRFDRPTTGTDNALNPWDAMLVHFAMRTPTPPNGNPVNLLEACTCVRLSTGTHGNPLIDAEVKSRCALVGTSTQAPTPVTFRSPVPASVVPRACGRSKPVVIGGRSNPMGPRACLDAVSCDESPGPDCARCSGEECVDYWGRWSMGVLEQLLVPGRVTSAHAAGYELPLADHAGCTALELETWVPGRPTRIRTPLRCAAPIQSARRDTQELPFDEVRGSVVVPERRVAGVVEAPAHVALLLETSPAGPLRLYEAGVDAGGWSVRPASASVVPAGETLLGFTAFPRTSGEGAETLLAVATSSGAGPILRIVRPATASAPAQVLGAAPACTPRPGCGLGTCTTTAPVTAATLTTADLDGDGVTDVLIGARGGRIILRYSGSATSPTGLAATCTCEAVGSELGSFEVAQLGGSDPLTADRLDVALGGADLRLGYGEAGMCSAEPPARLWRAPTTVLGRARLSRSDTDDLLVLEQNGESAQVRVVFGGDWDLTQLRLEPPAAWEPATQALDYWPVTLLSGPVPPPVVRAGDFNGDGAIDLLLPSGAEAASGLEAYPYHGDVRVWLGGQRRGLVEQQEQQPGVGESPYALRVCEQQHYTGLLAGDLDGDGASDVIALCAPTNLRGTTLEWHRTTAR